MPLQANGSPAAEKLPMPDEMLVCEEACGCRVFFLDETQFSPDSGDMAYIDYCSMHLLATVPGTAAEFVTAYGDMLNAIRAYVSPVNDDNNWDETYNDLKKAARAAEDAVL
jgi:hypothetical protein